MKIVHAYAAMQPGLLVEPFTYQLANIGKDEVDIKVEYCGLCHSDLSMLQNHWGLSTFPLVAGHEVIGTIADVGSNVPGLAVGQRVGMSWFSKSCMHCKACTGGDLNLCQQVEHAIVGRHGGFADLVRCNWQWTVPLPDTLTIASAGPLFCGGVTVFNPLVQFDVKPTDKVGVIGVGGLGHLAVQFLNKWGCEVTAFVPDTSDPQQYFDLGAHQVVNTTDPQALANEAGKYDFLLNTVNVTLDWAAFINALAAKGRFHTVGVVLEPIPAPALPMILQQRSISASPVGSPSTIKMMLDFCARHNIQPITQQFAMHDLNAALDHLHAGKAKYRIVLQA